MGYVGQLIYRVPERYCYLFDYSPTRRDESKLALILTLGGGGGGGGTPQLLFVFLLEHI